MAGRGGTALGAVRLVDDSHHSREGIALRTPVTRLARLRGRLLFSVGLALAVAGVVVACQDPTQITVRVTTDLPCDKASGLTVTTGRLGEIEDKAPSASTTFCENGLLGTVVMVPSGGKDEESAIRLVLGHGRDPESCRAPDYGPQCIVARRAVRYLSATRLSVPVVMRNVCDGIPCGPEETCVKGECRSARIDPAACTSAEGCGEDALTKSDTPSPSADGGRADGGITSDGGPSVDAGLDGGDKLPLPCATATGAVCDVSVGYTHACALLRDGRVKCWGPNSFGELGIGDRSTRGITPGQMGAALPSVPLKGRAVQVAAGNSTTCALLEDRRVQCWGDNGFGQLGLGLAVPDLGGAVGDVAGSSVVDVGGPVEEIGLGGQPARARLTTGAIKCWGGERPRTARPG